MSYYANQYQQQLQRPATRFSEQFPSRPPSAYAAEDGHHAQLRTILQAGRGPSSSAAGPPSYRLNDESGYAVPQYRGSSRQGSGDDAQTIGPYDSVSNAGEDSPHRGVTSYGGHDWMTSDPYSDQQPPPSRFSQVNYDDPAYEAAASRQRVGSSNSMMYENVRDSTAKLPLMHDPAGYAGATRDGSGKDSDEESMIEGDTVVNHRKGASGKKRGAPTARYPPTPYGNPDEKEVDDLEGQETTKGALLHTIKGENPSGERPSVWLRQIRDTTPLAQKIENHKRGIGVQDRPWACYVIAVICLVVFIVELVKSAQVTGKAISTSPFNYMIGPGSEMLINLGARFTPCMRDVPEISAMDFSCLNSTTSVCSLEDICGWGGFGADGTPSQTFRFFTPLWLHVGVVHIILNMLSLIWSSGLVEKQMGSLRFIILYHVGGIFGFVLGGNFSLTGIAAMGASGAIFATHSAVLVDLIAHWRIIERPKRLLFSLIFEIIVGIGLGYVPGVDNFSHLGGLSIGLLLSIVLVPMIHETRKRRIVVYVLRTIALVGAAVMFGVLVNNFFTSDPSAACSWCRYLSCWPTSSNNQCKGTGLTTTTTTSSSSDSSSDDGTVGSQVNTGLVLVYLVTQFGGSTFERRRKAAAHSSGL